MKKHVLFFSLFFMAAIYGSFLTLDITTGFSDSKYSAAVRYLCILICLILVFWAGKDANNPKDYRLVKFAFFFTACADFMMSMICNFPIFTFGFCVKFKTYKFGVGVLLFMIVQVIYIFRHSKNFKWSVREVATGVSVFVVMIDKIIKDSIHFTSLGGVINIGILVVVLLYAVILCISTWMAIGTLWRNYFPKQTALFIAIGMVLFFLCDNSLGRSEVFKDTVPVAEAEGFVVMSNVVKHAQVTEHDGKISVYTDADKMAQVTVPYTLRSICGILIWFFYLPAQVLLMLSAYNLKFLSPIFGLIKPERKKIPLYSRL